MKERKNVQTDTTDDCIAIGCHEDQVGRAGANVIELRQHFVWRQFIAELA